MKRNSSEIIKFLFMMGNMSTINTVLSDEDIELICMEFNTECHKEIVIEEDDIEEQIGARNLTNPSSSPARRWLRLWVTSITARPRCWIPSGKPM